MAFRGASRAALGAVCRPVVSTTPVTSTFTASLLRCAALGAWTRFAPVQTVVVRGMRTRTRAAAAGKAEGADKPASTPVEGLVGVWQGPPDADGLTFEAFIELEGTKVSGGRYETSEEAARAYDALARMYHGAEVKTNYKVDTYVSWVPPEAQDAAASHIQTKPGVPLTVDEVVHALEAERGIDVVALPLANRSDLAEHMVFVTGRSVPHMRKCADMLVAALRARDVRPNEQVAEVEGRDCDDWMLVDAGNIIINIFEAEARACFDFETMYSNMKLGEDPFDGMTLDEWSRKNPVPDKWIARSAREEQDK